MTFFSTVALLLLSFVNNIKGCAEISGIGDLPSDIYSFDDITIPLDIDDRSWSGSLTRGMFQNGQTGRETPIGLRRSTYNTIVFYQIESAYDNIALEYFGRLDVTEERRRCPNNITYKNSTLLRLHKAVSWVYLFYGAYLRFWGPFYEQRNEIYYQKLLEYGIDLRICDWDLITPKNGPLDINKINNNNYNNTCNDISTPWGLAYTIIKEIFLFADNDGWNEHGSYDRDYNRIPYSDYRDDRDVYIPKNSPWKLRRKDRWQPLLESDGMGFLYHQEHVVPHIGTTAKSLFFTDDEICDFEANNPRYNYKKEMQLTFDRLANLDDYKKMEIETFDDKGVLGRFERAVFDAYIVATNPSKSGCRDCLEYLQLQNIGITVLFEGIIIVWKEKVYWDKVRPPSIVQKQYKNKLITTYAGTTVDGESYGTQTFYGHNFEPFFRTMPHSEYPSGSACICQAWRDAMIEYFGFDNVTDYLPNGMQLNFNSLSSHREPLSTPSTDITLTYYSFSQVSEACGESRLNGGMHFTASVPEGQDLCDNIGKKVTQSVMSLRNGQLPQYIVDITDKNLIERDC